MNCKRSAVLRALALTFSMGLIIFAASAIAAAATLTVGNASSLPCTGTYSTISAAVAAAGPGDTIQVCPGMYNELVQVNKTLTILGAQSGVDARTRAVPVTSESVVSNGDGDFQILADKVVIDGFTIQGVVNPANLPPFTGLDAGIWTNPGFSGTSGGHQIRNNIIQNNIIGIELDNDGAFQTKVERNLIQNNNAVGPDGGTGIDTNFGLANAVIDSNKIAGNTNSGMNTFGGSSLTVSNNEFAANRRAIGWGGVTTATISGNNIHNSTDPATADIRFFGGVSGVAITCNNLSNGAGRGIRMDDECPGCPNSSININNNNISGYPVAGLEVDSGGYFPATLGSLNATNNWWGSSTGPTIASNPGGTGEPIIDPDGVVNYTPFRTTLSSCAPVPQIGPPTNKDQCKNGGWQTFNTPRTFKNQGDCIQFVNTGK